MNKGRIAVVGLLLISALGAGTWWLWPSELDRLTQRAESGEIAAQLELARILGGSSTSIAKVEPDTIAAAYWFERAAESGSLPAAQQLLAYYDSGVIDSENGAKSIDLLRRMTAMKDPDAAWILYERLKATRSEEARKQLQAAAELGSANAQFKLALTLEVESARPSEIYRWMRAAALQGNAEAQYRMGKALLSGPLNKDQAKAQEWFLQAAKQEHPIAMYLTAEAYLRSMATRRHAVPLLEKAVEAGVKDAEIVLARAYTMTGKPNEGNALYKRLALLGNEDALTLLGGGKKSPVELEVEEAVWRRFQQGWQPQDDLHQAFRSYNLSHFESLHAQWLLKKLELEARELHAVENNVEPPTFTELERRVKEADSIEAYYSWTGDRWQALVDQQDSSAAWTIAQEVESRAAQGESPAEEARWWLRLAAEMGATPAQLALWRWYSGDSTSHANPLTARLWLERASRNSAEAKYHLACDWLNSGLVNSSGATDAARLLLTAANEDYEPARVRLNSLLFKEKTVKQLTPELVTYLESLTGEAEPGAAYLLAIHKGKVQSNTRSLPPLYGLRMESQAPRASSEELQALLEKAVAGGITEAKTVLARMLLFPLRDALNLDRIPGIGTPIQLTESKEKRTRALQLLEEAAGEGDMDARALIETMRFNGKIVPFDPITAAVNFHALAEDGFPVAKSLFTLRSSSNQTETDAPTEESGTGESGTFRTSVEVYYEAHVKRTPEAMMILGLNEELTKGYEDPVAERLRWLNEAARDEWPDAYEALAAIYWDGLLGVEKDRIRAFRWMTLAADVGNAEAAFAVGASYASGEPAGKDEELALQYLKMSADNGHAMAAQLLQQIEKASGKKASEESVHSLLAENRGTLEATPLKILGFAGQELGMLTGFSWGRPLLARHENGEPFRGDKDSPFIIVTADSFAEGMIRVKSLLHITPLMALQNGIIYTGLSERLEGVIEPDRVLNNCLAVLVVREGEMPEPKVSVYAAKLGNLQAGRQKKFTIKIPDNPYLNIDRAAFYVFSDGVEVMTNTRIQYMSLGKERYINHFYARLDHLKAAREKSETKEATLWDPEMFLQLVTERASDPVRVRLHVSPLGSVREVELLEKAPENAAKRIIKVASELLFLPAVKDGQPCDSEVILKFELI